jgi:hypothetical protein
MPSASAAAALVLLVPLATGCIFDQRRKMTEARSAYEACVAEHPHDAERECAVEKAELDTRTERYEQDAQQAWGCTGRTENCDPRERAPDVR